ncbi:MAG: hypothetical protein A3J46_05375 [Candidatus Yanofskybacteria bacterium RIFCSPHIGHO2_02_FULL_41_11]|uniref:NadR/Ttd14 AAA domain-containing protein n=1 Tax=Candidatus Yanofskybacteria bacterium RIFCSPHIGHO2_02_FULL_41_11 TaxID=1802675 RepID=A0A1F8FDI6_9BACT|nr:MAG: hypothetical protein A3J46_05375 [Candidatus Yanofskybacteria bacterium RIFCSPHIGHO2_02_FULL_41_11]
MSVDTKFKEKRGRIMAYLRSDFRHDSTIPRPFVFEFNGPPHSGKTTTIIELDKFLRRQGFRVLRPQESGEAIRHIDRSVPVYNIRTGLYTLTHLLDHVHDHSYDVIIYDRGIFDAYCWMSYWEEKGKITKKQMDIVQNFFFLDLWLKEIDRAYFMVCDSQKARKRELDTSLSKKLDTKNIETVKLYRKTYDNLSKTFPQLKLIDTSNLNKKEVAEKIALDLLGVMEHKSEK